MPVSPGYPISPPIEPMLAAIADGLPSGDFLFEPKWDGFRAIVYRGGESDLYIQSRELKPLDRYFPELHDALVPQIPPGTVLDGEIVIATDHGLDFEALQQRIHPAASRIAKLAKETPTSFVAFDLLAVEGRDIRDRPQEERREALERMLAGARPPLHSASPNKTSTTANRSHCAAPTTSSRPTCCRPSKARW